MEAVRNKLNPLLWMLTGDGLMRLLDMLIVIKVILGTKLTAQIQKLAPKNVLLMEFLNKIGETHMVLKQMEMILH